MGCGSSSSSSESSKNSGLRLLSSKLHFKSEQLDKLTDYFSELARSDREEATDLVKLEARVERLVQRLLAGLGNLDHRFASCFLVSLNERRRIKQLRFEYLLRLDALSTPTGNSDVAELALQLEEDTSAPGFARLRLKAGDAGVWTEFFGPDGRLRRDLVKSKIAAVLAQAMKPDAINGIDERLCITPGQVVDPEVLDKILKQPEHCRIFYGPAEDDLPVIGDHRVAIVEDESGILLKIGLNGSKSQDIEVRVLIGVSMNSWPNCVDYPKRIPLHHCDALLHYTAAQTGMYLVAVGPHQGLRCDDKASLWRVRLFAAEKVMREHYSAESVVSRTEAALMHILDQLRARRPIDFSIKRKGKVRLVSRHIVRAIHWWSLEQGAGPDPLRSWSSESLAQHVLLSLDELVRALRCQNLRCYFQPRCNLMLQCARGGTLAHQEDAYATDARLLEAYLAALHGYSLEWLHSPLQRSLGSADLLERELVARWRQVMASLPRDSMSGHYGYGQRQLQYLGLLVKEILRAKDSLHQASYDTCSSLFSLSSDWQCGQSIDNLVYLLNLGLRQARDQVSHFSVATSSSGRGKRKGDKQRTRAERKRSCAKAYFERSVDVLIDVVRKDRETAYLDLDNMTIMAKTLLKWLYFAMEEDKKVLGPLLRPYLGNLFNASHEYAWHAESWRARLDRYSSEQRSLAAFCKLVARREIQPANGIVESLSKGWCWPDDLARQIERAKPQHGLKLVFLTPERILRYQMKFAEDQGPNSYSTWSKARSLASAVRKSSVARATMITATDTLLATLRAPKDEAVKEKGHVELRDRSPLTLAAVTARRRGRQRGPAGLIPALVSLNKFRVLQEVAQLLPPEERNAMLEMVRQVSRDAARRRLRRASCPDPASVVGAQRQVYTPRSESKLYEVSSSERDSPNTRQQRIIQERQLKVHREISEIHDTLTRGLRSRSQLPGWDTTSIASASWAASSSAANSIGRTRLKRHQTAIWDNVRGTSPTLWDSVSCNSTFSRVKSVENHAMIEVKHNEKQEGEDADDSKLPTWDLLENALNSRFSTYNKNHQANNSIDGNKDMNVDYLVISNDTKELTKKPT